MSQHSSVDSNMPSYQWRSRKVNKIYADLRELSTIMVRGDWNRGHDFFGELRGAATVFKVHSGDAIFFWDSPPKNEHQYYRITAQWGGGPWKSSCIREGATIFFNTFKGGFWFFFLSSINISTHPPPSAVIVDNSLSRMFEFVQVSPSLSHLNCPLTWVKRIAL